MFSANASQVAAGGSSTDPQFNYVTMLLHGDGTNGAQNNTFLDSSTNNFTITRNGNTTQGSFSPYGTLWSNYFDGTGDYLSLPASSSWVTGSSGSVTIEFWANATADGYYYLMDQGAGNQAVISIGFTASTGYVYWYNGGTFLAQITNLNIPSGIWTHFAFVLVSGTPKVYVNGVQQSGTYNNGSFGQNATLEIGRFGGGTSYYFKGYISNFRFVSGQAIYTANFTPSTTPLTAVSGTSLLTCQSNRFIDNSSNAFTVTVNGNPSVQRFSPFAPSAAYSTATIGGSGYFDGSGDYLDVNSTSTFDFGTGDLTIEFWAKPNAATNYQGVVCVTYNGGNPNNGYLIVELSPARGLFVNADAFSTEVSSTAAYPAYENAWHHWAVTRASGTWKIFKDGVSQTLATNTIGSANFTGTTGVIVGAQVGSGSSPAYYPFNGNLSDVRIVKGTAVYTSNFTPPTAPLTAITNTQLLTNFTNGAIFDNAMMNDLETVGNAQISTSVKKYGTGSIYFAGANHYLANVAQLSATFGTGSFTIEFWMYLPGTQVNVYGTVFDTRPSGTTSASYPRIYMEQSGNVLVYQGDGGTIVSSALSNTTWHHIAVVRSGTTTTLYVNGTSDGTPITGAANDLICNPAGAWVGANSLSPGNYQFYGYIDDLRITKGYARYTANFTPPTAAFPNL